MRAEGGEVGRAVIRGIIEETVPGRIAVHQKGSHRYFADPISGGVLTTAPMHPGDIARSLRKKIIKDAGLTEEEFRRLL
jgi:predicted RNA binding protein YcfA (HicA-like mRNA interferase family)